MMKLIKKVNEIIQEKNRNDQFSGVVLIQREDEVLLESVQGYANRSWDVKNQADTRFRIGSISKMFTAVAILQLIESGELSLEASAVDFLELEDTRIPQEATVFHLLTMTSGIADWFDETGDWEKNWAELIRENPIYLFRRNQDYLPLFLYQEPIFPVGEKHQYNGAGYILLGLMIEKLSGLSYFDYIQRQIFGRGEMSRSCFAALDDVYGEIAEGYIPIEDQDEKIVGWKRNIYATTPAAAADGGAVSTAGDLLRFSRALRNGDLLSAEMTREALTPKVLSSDEKFRGYTWEYGYGNYFISDPGGRIVRWGHTGEEDGVSCRLYYYPREKLDVIILGNQSWCAGSLGWEIHDLIVGASPE